jgi:hypothetical protein
MVWKGAAKALEFGSVGQVGKFMQGLGLDCRIVRRKCKSKDVNEKEI